MTLVTKNVGRLPGYPASPQYDSQTAYGRKQRCIQYGCELESLVDNNTYTPFAWDGDKTFTLDDAHWRLISGNPEVWAAGNPKPATTGTTGDYPYNGMGRVVLAKNMVNVAADGEPEELVNTLTQDMFYKGEVGSRVPNTNTVFVIQYDFVLGENITIPAGCVLEFDGGSINGAYTVTGTDTGIVARLVKVFDVSVTLAGTWNVSEVYPEWFGAKGDGTNDDADAITKCLSFSTSRKVILSFGKTYLISHELPVKSNTEIVLDGTVKNDESQMNQSFAIFDRDNPAYAYNGIHDVYIHGIGTYDANGSESDSVSTPFRMYHAQNIIVEGISVIGWKQYHAFEIGGCKDVLLKGIHFYGGVSLGGDVEVIQVERCIGDSSADGSSYYDNTPVENLTIDGCIFEPKNGFEMKRGIGSHSGRVEGVYYKNINIVNCLFKLTEANSNRCILFDYDVKGLTVKNCHFDGYAIIMEVPNGYEDLSIEDNVIENCSIIPFYIDKPGQNIKVCGNLFKNCCTDNDENVYLPCFYITGSPTGSIIIKENTFYCRRLFNPVWAGDGIVGIDFIVWKDNILIDADLLSAAAKNNYLTSIGRIKGYYAPHGDSWADTNKESYFSKVDIS